jgi:hypothetical protein
MSSRKRHSNVSTVRIVLEQLKVGDSVIFEVGTARAPYHQAHERWVKDSGREFSCQSLHGIEIPVATGLLRLVRYTRTK